MRTITIDVPRMKNDSCAEIVFAAVNRTPSVVGDKTRIDMQRRTVTVTYESLNLSLKNVEFAISESGFQANEVPANPQAAEALPPECK